MKDSAHVDVAWVICLNVGIMEKAPEQVMKGRKSHVIALPEFRRSLQLVFSLTSVLVLRHPRLAQSEWEVVSIWRHVPSEIAATFKVKDT